MATQKKLSLIVVFAFAFAAVILTVTGASSGVPAAVWSLKGNRGSQPGLDFLGTSDNEPLILKTNSTPVLTLGTSGPVEVHKALIVHGDTTVDANLRIAGDLSAAGGITLTGPLALGGDLDVSGQAQFAQDASVAGVLHAASVVATTSVTAASIEVSGTTRTGVLEITGGDVAEPFGVANPKTIPAGAVVVIDDQHPGELRLTDRRYDRRVAGVVSGAGGMGPGIVMYRQNASQSSRTVALAGRVLALADDSNGAIRPGDLLTTSAIPGHVMKATDYERSQGAVIGKAMSSLASGEGLLLVLVSLQ